MPPWAQFKKFSFVLDDAAGQRWDLSQNQARLVVVNFFATWCEPCREELPMLERLLRRSPGIAVFAVSVAEPDDRVRRFLEHVPLSFPVVLDRDRGTAKAWRVETLPTTYLLDHQLKLRRMVEGELAWDRLDAQQLLKALPPMR